MNNKISSEVRLSVTTTTTTTTAEVAPDAIDIEQSCSAKSVEDAVADKPQLATWSDVFMFASHLDWLLMGIGSLFAMAKGCLLPIVMINFSSLIHGFVKIDEETLVSNSSTTISAVTFPTVNSTITPPISHAASNLNFTFTNIATLFGPINVVDCFNLSNPDDLEQFHRQLRFLYTNQTSNWTDLPQHCRRLALDTAGEIIMFNVYGYLVIAAAIFLTAFVHSLCWNISAVRQCSAMRREMFRGIMRQDIGWFDAEEANSRQLPTQLSECVNKIQDGLQQIDMFFENTCGFLAAFTVALVYGWELGLIIMGITPFIALSGWFMMRVSSRASAHEMLAYARAGAVAEETFASIRTVAALGCEQKQAEKYSQALEPATNAGVRKGVAVGIGQGAIWGVIFVSYALAFGVGAWLVRRSIYNGNDGRYNVGTLVVVFLCVQIGARQLGQIMPNLQEIANIQAAAHVVVQIVRQTPIIDSACSSGQHPLSTIGKISFKSVSFSYPARQDAQILENFSLEIESGTTVALVGASGCGKSTIVQLLERFYDPTSGAILIDDIDLRDWNVAHLRNVIGIVGQEPVLFSTTIGENIRLGRQTLTDIKQAEVDDACRKANIYDFIQCLLQNYSTPVGNKGSQLLSGGEKQRIAIARALIKAPPILLLDEATSALDSNSERLVQQAIDNIATVSGQRRRTVIVVAHRLSTIVNADKIVALKDGQIVESGTHAELMSKKGLYFSLVQAQISQGVKRRRRKESDATCSDSSGDSGNDDDSDGENRARKPHKEALEKMKANGLLSMAAMLASSATNATSRRKTLSPLQTIITGAPSNDRDNSPAPHLPRSRAASLVQSTLNYARSARNSLLPSPTFYNAGAAAEADGGDDSNVSAAMSATAALDMMSMHLCVSPFHSDRRPSSYSAVFRAVQEEKVAEEEEIEQNFGGFSRAESMMANKTAHDSNPKHKPRRKGPQLIRLIRMNAPEWWLILLGLIGAICTGAIMPVYAVLLSEMLRVFADPDLQRQAREAMFWSLMFLVLGVVCFVANLFQFSFLGVAGERLTTRLRRRVFSAILRQDVQFFDQPRNHVGALTTRLTTDTAAVQAATGSALALIVQSACTLAVAFGIGIYFAWKVVLVCIGTIPFIMAGSFLEQKILTRQAVSSQSALEKASSIVVEAVEQIRTVTMLNLQHHFVHEFEKQMHHANRNAFVRACTMSFAFAYSQSIRFVAFSLAFWAGWQFIRASWLDDEQKVKFDFSDMLKALFGIMYGAISIGQASSFTQSFGKAKISSARIFRLIDQRPKIDLSDNGLCPPEALGEIEFKNVRFRHVTRRTMPLLRGLSLKIQPKQSFALVGHSGCGKSTIFQLLLRFYEPQEGEILLDGKEIEKYNLKWLRKQFALVGQEPVLFSGTVRENIGYGCEQPPSYEEIVASATAANAHAFIMQLPLQYDTSLGNAGHVQLSGGQKQRIAIARALARKPRILLLDEATSALDTESEQLVQKALLDASKGVTSITIAHRLHTIENCDAIAVIDKGRLAEFGTHKQLMQLKDHGMYFKAQQQTSLKTDKPATRNDSAKITKML